MDHRAHPRPIVIAHRGASGYMPEHTLAAYATAILQGADFIEPDLVMTGDGHLIARHDNLLDRATDVAERPEYADRHATKVVNGEAASGWFSEDFTLDEVATLLAVERMADVRPANARFDRQFRIPTLQAIVDLARAFEGLLGRPIGIYPETKHPTYFAGLGLDIDAALVECLHRNAYERTPERVFIQSFEVGNLRRLSGMTTLALVQLLGDDRPYDRAAAGEALTYEQMASPDGLAAIADYAQGIGPHKSRILRRGDAAPTGLVADAHEAGLLVHPYTFRGENHFLPTHLRRGGEPAAIGNLAAEIDAYLAVGIDGLFTDHSDIGVRARDAFVHRVPSH